MNLYAQLTKNGWVTISEEEFNSGGIESEGILFVEITNKGNYDSITYHLGADAPEWLTEDMVSRISHDEDADNYGSHHIDDAAGYAASEFGDFAELHETRSMIASRLLSDGIAVNESE